MNKHWTGGQYSVFRVIFGVYLFVHFFQLIPWAAEMYSWAGVLADGHSSPLIFLFPNVLALIDAPWFVTVFIATAAVAAICFMLGYRDRAAALLMWYVLACLFGRNPLTANPSLPFVGWMLLAHLVIPSAPYGSLAARGRRDPGGNWFMPKWIFSAAWIVMALGYSYSGWTKLISPSWVDGTAIYHVLSNSLARPTFMREFLLSLPMEILQVMTWSGLVMELAFAPLVLVRRLRGFVWLAMLSMHVGLMVLIDFADLSLGMIMLHLFTFDPGWVRPRRISSTITLYYDGHCGLCHRFVRFLLAEDRSKVFRFAPLQSESFENAVAQERRETLPDSVVLLSDEGNILTSSTAIVYTLKRLGGVWRVLGSLLWVVPKFLRDGGYRFVAAVRYKLFKKPAEMCPMIPGSLQERFIRDPS
ncbi:MAG: DUF393 domain-containing protein [Planctomycetes bacterium]|nr:DUF393 domain-containing protein [Planctomycetota bacterium]